VGSSKEEQAGRQDARCGDPEPVGEPIAAEGTPRRPRRISLQEARAIALGLLRSIDRELEADRAAVVCLDATAACQDRRAGVEGSGRRGGLE
jgi:hypothetical protein